MTIQTTTVKAEDAPIGKLLWPVISDDKAPNFTLMEIRIVRREGSSYVTWIYENGNERHFDLGEDVCVTLMQCPTCDRNLMMPSPKGQPGDDSYYCDECGQAWDLDLRGPVL